MADGDGVRPARTDDDVAAARALFLTYADSLDIDLCFQDFDAEMARFPGDYQPPGGDLFVAVRAGAVVGAVGLRPAPDGFAEMKRLYLTDAARGGGLGRGLAEAVVHGARRIGYRGVVLDTLPSMTAAHALYRRMGFESYRPAADGGHPDLSYFRLVFDA
jgi:ribosomal protein S18 acetylase RimI-like enzyme